VKAMAQVNIRIDDEIKEKAEHLFFELGLNFSTAVNIFVRQSVRQGGLPFMVTTDIDFYAVSDTKKPTRKTGGDLPRISSGKNSILEITLASESALAKEWLLPEEDEAWASL
jgi:addiction module RelB/DinJ family antitoxin